MSVVSQPHGAPQHGVAGDDAREVTPLIRYALRGLKSCWMPRLRRWSYIYHLDGRSEPNQSFAEGDAFYTLNVLLGFSRARHLAEAQGFDLAAIFEQNALLLPTLGVPKYAYGMALWAAAELGLAVPAATMASLSALLDERQHWEALRAQDLGMILIGCVEQARRGSDSLGAAAHELFGLLDRRYACPSGLFFEGAGLRRRFSSFATNTYLTLACYVYAEWSGSERALALAKACTRKLIACQGQNGEWPWFFYTPGGRVVDFYEVYSVHQHGMAPAFLEFGERHGIAEATGALVKGFKWVFGQNQMNRSMLWHREGLICRSLIRKGEMRSRKKSAVRAVVNGLLRQGGELADPASLELRLECRSYELGWILWSFGRRNDLPEIHHHPELSREAA